MDPLVERDLAPASGLLAPAHLLVVRHGRGWLQPRLYNKLVDHFHSAAVKLDRLSALWAQVVLHLFPQALRVNGRRVLVGDGIKVPKRGKKMPGVTRFR